jgi:phage terminase large subunit
LQLLRELRPLQIEVSDELWPGYEETRPDYRSYGASLNLQTNIDREILIAGPAGTGKTRSILEKFHRLAQEYPGARFLFVRKSRESLSESALQIFEQWVLGPGHPLVVDGPRRDNRKIYQYPNGSEILVGGMNQTKKVMSTEYDGIAVFEAIELTEEDWENLMTRLRNYIIPYQQIVGDTNPDIPTHWLKLRCNAGITTLLESYHQDNPKLYNQEIQDWTPEGKEYIFGTLGNLSGVRRLRLLEGKWVKAEGLVFEDWDDNVHVIDRFKIPPSWKKFRVVDFGFVNPFVCGWFALDEDDRIYLFKYIYMTRKTVKVHSVEIKKHTRGMKGIERVIVCDHDAEDQATLRENGLLTTNADKRVRIGLDKVMERLKVQEDGRPRFFILRDSLIETDRSLVDAKKPYKIEQEFDGYVWKEKSKKEEPVKDDDHGMDLIRYAIMHIDGKPKGWSRGASE